VLDEADGPSEALVEQAAALYTLRDLDAELLELLSDTRDDAGVLTRAEQLDWRLVVFQGASCTVTIEISGDDGEPSVIGSLQPAGAYEVALLDSSGGRSSSVSTDDGRFSTPCPPGPFQVLITLDDGRRAVTPLIVV
jgi:hypothetical protein